MLNEVRLRGSLPINANLVIVAVELTCASKKLTNITRGPLWVLSPSEMGNLVENLVSQYFRCARASPSTCLWFS